MNRVYGKCLITPTFSKNIGLLDQSQNFSHLAVSSDELFGKIEKNILQRSLLLFVCGYMQDSVHSANKQLWRA